uniref:Putative Ty-1 copia retrotransposon n=1 Tax=Davidia involucrata TaxID=16924 RepID=A0A5B6Z910_DAVIN
MGSVFPVQISICGKTLFEHFFCSCFCELQAVILLGGDSMAETTETETMGVTKPSEPSKPSTSSSVRRTMLSNVKFEVEKFDGTNNFGMWQCEVLDLLFRKGSHIALDAKPKDISNEDWNFINRQACSTIRLCLAKDQKYFVMKETVATSLWKKLEDKYMTKSIENRLYLKKKLFHFQFKHGTEEGSADSQRSFIIRSSDSKRKDTQQRTREIPFKVKRKII